MDENPRSVITFTGISHALVHTYELSIPILVVIWLVELQVSTALVGFVVSIGYGLLGIGALPGGILADRLESRLLILGCLGGMALSFLLLSVADGIGMIAIALSIWGLAASVYHPSGLSLISTSVGNRGTAFAYHGMAGNIGIALGPLITALLLLKFDWRVVTRILIFPTALAIAYGLKTEFDEGSAKNVGAETNRSPSTTVSDFVRNSRALFTVGFTLALVVVMMNGLFYRGVLTFLPEMLNEFLPSTSNYIQLFKGSPIAEQFTLSSYIYVGLLTVGIGGQYVAGKTSDKISPITGLVIVFTTLGVITVGFVPAAQLGVLPLLLVGGILGFFLFALQPLYQATIAEYSPPDDRGLSYGYTYLTSFGIGASGATISGYLLTEMGTTNTFLVLAVFPVLGALVSGLMLRTDTKSN